MMKPETANNLMTASDTNAAALAGQLGKCSSFIVDIFFALDGALASTAVPFERHPLTRDGEWLARSYKLGSKSLLRVDPKQEWLKVQVGSKNAPAIPDALRPVGEVRSGWMVITPATREIGIDFAVNALIRNAE